MATTSATSNPPSSNNAVNSSKKSKANNDGVDSGSRGGRGGGSARGGRGGRGGRGKGGRGRGKGEDSQGSSANAGKSENNQAKKVNQKQPTSVDERNVGGGRGGRGHGGRGRGRDDAKAGNNAPANKGNSNSNSNKKHKKQSKNSKKESHDKNNKADNTSKRQGKNKDQHNMPQPSNNSNNNNNNRNSTSATQLNCNAVAFTPQQQVPPIIEQNNENTSNNKSSSDKKKKKTKNNPSEKGRKNTEPTPNNDDGNSQDNGRYSKKVDKNSNSDKSKKTKKNEKKKPNNKESQQPTVKKNNMDSAAPYAPAVPPNQPQQTSDINYGRGKSIAILHVAEKPSIAQAVARGLMALTSKGEGSGGGGGSGGGSGGRGATPVHKFEGPEFPKAPFAASCAHKVTSVTGHVYETDFPQEFQSWDSVDPAELFQAPVKKKACKGSIVRHLQETGRGVDFIVLWMDCDREGENINFEVLDSCMHLMKASGGSSPNFSRVYRAFFSAINPSDIKKAYAALGKPDKNQALSVEARQELDLKVGVAFSRFQTRYFQGRYGDLDSAVLSYGPCQTPTLGFCVQRHIDIETFKPEPYWTLELAIMKRGRQMKALWDGGRSFKKHKIEALQQKALDENAVVEVTNVITKEKKQGRPVPLNTVGLLKACSKALGIGPHAAMQTAERLYLSGYLSYPRTESTAYPKSFDIIGTLREQSNDRHWGTEVRNLLQEGPTKGRGGVDMGDHPPITPCRATHGELSGDQARIYELVVRHFVASVSADAVWQSTRVDFSIPCLEDKGTFTLRAKTLVSPGFLAVLLHKSYGEDEGKDADDDEEEGDIASFTKGEQIPLVNPSSGSNSSKIAVASGLPVRGSLSVREKMTTPPTYLTESDLIGLMEKNGIGTDASIPAHIQNIQNRNYVTLESGRRLIPGKLGLVLVQGYHQIDSSLVLPQVRSDIEDQCNKICKGIASKDDVVKRALALFRGKFDLFVENIGKMDVLFGSSFAKLEDVGQAFTRCGQSRRYLQYIPGPPPRLYNKWTESVYPLPAGGIIKQWTGRMCPLEKCKFELCMYSIGNPQRTFPLCPRCFNDIDWALNIDGDIPEDPDEKEDKEKERKMKKVAGRMLVLECPLPDEHPIIEDLMVSPDPDTDGGALILDPHFGPKWRLVSTRSPTIVHLPQSISKVTILERKDEVLGVHMMKIEFKAGESPLPDGKTSYTSCFPTDELLQKMVRVHHGSERLKASGRGGRGRGRGGRGRGRGRGGGGRGRR